MKLGDFIDFCNGRTSPERLAGASVPVMGSNGCIGFAEDSNVEQPCTVIGRVGSYCGSTHFVEQPCWVTDNAISAVSKDPRAARFWHGFLANFGLNMLAHGSGQPLLTQSVLKNIDVPNFTNEERYAIADVLGALDDKIAANQRVQESGLDLIKALWQKAQRTSTNEVLIGDIIEVNPRTQLADTPEVAFLDMKNLPEDGHLPCTWEMKESRSGSKFLNGDTLLGRITPCFENRKLGYVDFLEEGEAGLGSTEFIVFRPKEDTPRAIPLCIASSDSFRSEAQLNMVGTSGRQRVTADFVKQFPVRWPTAEVLHDFSEATSPLLEKFSLLTKENQSLARTRDELLPLLMSGKITVAETEQEVEGMGVDKRAEGDSDV